MFEKFFQKRQEKKTVRDFAKSSLGKALRNHTEEFFQKPRLSAFQHGNKKEIIENFSLVIISILQAKNPLLAMREALVGYSFEYVKFHLLALNEEEKIIRYGENCTEISGQLYKYIDKATDYHDDLREAKWRNPDITNEELISVCNTRSLLLLYYINGINYVRMELKDYDDKKDWLKPFLKSVAIFEENNIRKHIGLPCLLTGEYDGLMHSTFANFVMSNCRNPYLEWEKAIQNN